MSFENPSSQEQPKSLLETLRQEISEAEADLKGHYKKGSGDGYDTYKEGKEKSTDLLAMRKAAKALEAAGGDAEAALATLADEIEEGAMANPDVVERARALLERKSQAD